jgi:hypothetical protein
VGQNRGSGLNPHRYAHFIFDKGAKNIQSRKDREDSKMAAKGRKQKATLL